METGALIVASLRNDDDRDGNESISAFLPMLHLDGTTVIKREIALLRKAKVSPIIVLCGYQQEVLRNHLSHNGVLFCEDEQYESHTLTETLEAGIAFGMKHCERLLVLPVEYPGFSSELLQQLLEHETSVYPVYQGITGFPRLLVKGEEEENKWSAEAAWLSCKGTVPDLEKLDTDAKAWPFDTKEACSTISLASKEGCERIREQIHHFREANTLHLKTKLILSREEDFFGPGIYRLLRYIGELGSIQAAAAKMEMSYTKGWKMINKAEKEIGFRLIERTNGGRHGGSSRLTEEAVTFLDRYQALNDDIRRISQSFFDQYFSEFQ